MDYLNKKDLSRYHRQIILPQVGESGQEKLQNAKVLVIGAGGLGSPVLLYLTAAGIGTIGVIDFDKVDLSNLHRQILFNTNDLGKHKIEIAAERLSQLNPAIKIVPYNFKLTKDNVLNIIKDYDIIVDGSDNFPTRYMVSDATVILNKPLVYGAVHQFIGQASVFNYKDGPTYRCLFPEQPKHGETLSCSTAGVLGVLPGIIGSIQANETIKIILDIGDTLSGRLFQINSLDFSIDLIDVAPDPIYKNINKLGNYDFECNTSINNINCIDLHKELKHNSGIEIFDLRDLTDFGKFNIGGQNISAHELLNNIDLIPKNKKVIIICECGEQSSAIVEYLQEKHKFNNIYNLEGGINEWLRTT
ncbi:MAG: HesA/MoeB/ThiF family protein [Bacteroidales bacterium]|jgi:adenylyltransferase/sulfurtransferase|nr:HesA/MoeB/ThiF family protein [Bacteroidales bacterium]